MPRTTRTHPITPLPVPCSARSLLLFGGMFDPPHKAHIELSRSVRDRLLGRRAWLVYVPAASSPHKPDGPVAGNADRIRMLRLCLERVPHSAIWTDEIDRGPGPSFWIDTLRRAAHVAPPGAHIRFLVGSDQAIAFHRWREAREILSLAEPIVLLRPPHRTATGVIRAMRATGAWSKPELKQWGMWIDDDKTLDVSSTRVRRSMAGGLARGLAPLPACVRAYIRRRGLYQSVALT